MTTAIKRYQTVSIQEKKLNRGEKVFKISLERFKKVAGTDFPFLNQKIFLKTCRNFFAFKYDEEINYYLCNGYVYLFKSSGSFREDMLRLKKIKRQF